MLRKFKSITRDWALSHRDRFSKNKVFKMLTMCKKCYTFYYKKAWHFEKPGYFEQINDEEVPVRFTECPACLEQEAAMYENEVETVFNN